MCFNPPVRRVPSPNRYMAVARFCFCKNNKRTIDCSGGSGGVRLTHGPRRRKPRMYCQFCSMKVGADGADAWACSRDVRGSILARSIAIVCLLVIMIGCTHELGHDHEALVSSLGHLRMSTAEMRDCSLALLLISFACDHVVKEAQSSALSSHISSQDIPAPARELRGASSRYTQ